MCAKARDQQSKSTLERVAQSSSPSHLFLSLSHTGHLAHLSSGGGEGFTEVGSRR